MKAIKSHPGMGNYISWALLLPVVLLFSADSVTASMNFVDVTAYAGVQDSGESETLAWCDYDRDGYDDILLENNVYGGFRLFKNNGDGTFTDVAAGPLRVLPCHTSGVSWGDYDNDGDLDLYLADWDNNNLSEEGWDGGDHLLRNDGNDVFVDVAADPIGWAPDSPVNRWAYAGIWGDYNNDGYLDLYLSVSQGPDVLIRNEGDGTFSYETNYTLAGPNTTGAEWADYDNDGDLDIWVVQWGGWPRLKRNDGNGVFSENWGFPIVGSYSQSSISWGDYDNDGYFDAYICNTTDQTNLLYRNNTGVTFSQITAAPGVSCGNSIDAIWGDFDNDADLDLYVVNRGTANMLFVNNGDGTFTEDTPPLLARSGEDMRAAAADYDNDGDLDLYLIQRDGENVMLRNEPSSGYHWIEARLYGSISNACAIGARVNAIGDGLIQTRQVSAGNEAQGSLTVHFGLGASASVGQLVILWPSGIVQTFENVSADQILDIHEPTISGTVTSGGSPLNGVIVDLYSGDEEHVLIESVNSDLDGRYVFAAPAGAYSVEIVLPLGYACAIPSQAATVSRLVGEVQVRDFQLEEIVCSAEARGKGYWKHQYKVYDSGKGNARESLSDLQNYQADIWSHFHQRGDAYAIQLTGVTCSGGPTILSFDDALATLSRRGNASMAEKAEQHFLALLLNVVSGKVATYHVASEDGATISQVVTFIADLIEDGNPDNDELAKDLAELVNENREIGSGVVPLTTPHIAFAASQSSQGRLFSFAYPNPTRGSSWVECSSAVPDEPIQLDIYDVMGRRVNTLYAGPLKAAGQRIYWSGDDQRGRPAAAGIYFFRLRGDGWAMSRKVLLLR